jgi:Cu+-exporting ATPase
MAQAKDPVCGMTINVATAAAARPYDGHTYYFCSAGCFEAFGAEPGKYVAADAAAPAVARAERPEDQAGLEQHEPPRTTTGWFTAPKFGGAGSGGLEYERLPEAHGDETSDA